MRNCKERSAVGSGLFHTFSTLITQFMFWCGLPTVARLLDGFRKANVPIIHTRECHKPDLSDCSPAKRLRGAPALRIGDPGPMGRVLIAGELGADIVQPCPIARRDRHRQAGQGRVLRHLFRRHSAHARRRTIGLRRDHNRCPQSGPVRKALMEACFL
jgi:hypothetical protein